MCKVLLLAAAFVAAVSAETSVELIAPIEGTEGPQLGLIFIPGATLGGETYGPLSVAIQGRTRCASAFLGEDIIGSIISDFRSNFPGACGCASPRTTSTTSSSPSRSTRPFKSASTPPSKMLNLLKHQP